MKVLLCHNEYRQPGGEDMVFRESAHPHIDLVHRGVEHLQGHLNERIGTNLVEILRGCQAVCHAHDIVGRQPVVADTLDIQ